LTPSTSASIEQQFDGALAHARLPPDKVKLWMVPAPPQPLSARAAWYYPGFEILEGPSELLRGDQRVEANGAQHRELHRLAVRTGLDLSGPTAKAIVGGLIRHELEHAIQWEVWGPFGFPRRVTDALFHAVDRNHRGLRRDAASLVLVYAVEDHPAGLRHGRDLLGKSCP
jgi:hypothetical protein